MGQSITVQSKQVGGACIFTTDRVLSGQDGEGYASREEADAVDTFPAQLAARLFAADEAISNVFVASSEVVVSRGEAWDEAAVENAATTISDLHRFYQ
ncbi:MAG: hypothetical protein QNJ81_02820 [Acidimicrobiia bacterium]|nr:hypothetical protein [Acidimicrobiia bacterium]